MDNKKVDNSKQEIIEFSQVNSEKSPISYMQVDLEGIRAIATEREVFRLLVNSMCPGIYGHEIVKGTYSRKAIIYQ